MINRKNEQSTGLETAPEEIKLAVDLIQLLEENELELETTIQALEIVLADFKNKRKK
jgi:hypothetical protein